MQRKLTVWDCVQALSCMAEECYIEYNQVEPTQFLDDPDASRAAKRPVEMLVLKTPEGITIKRDMYRALCRESKIVLYAIYRGIINTQTDRITVMKKLREKGWSDERVQFVFGEVEKFIRDIKNIK